MSRWGTITLTLACLVNSLGQVMDPSIFRDCPMDLNELLFGARFEERVDYDSEGHSVFVDLTSLQVRRP
jgi:hypothetical protein